MLFYYANINKTPWSWTMVMDSLVMDLTISYQDFLFSLLNMLKILFIG